MLKNLAPQPPDALLALIKLHAADPRPDKIDLGVGVYRDEAGATPVFRSIKAAEQKLVDEQESKSYLGPEGDTGFVTALMPYIFGKNPTRGGRIEGMQTPGGTGAVRLALALVQQAGAKRVLMGTPSWPNHAQILRDVGLEIVPFAHANEDGTADMTGVLEAIDASGEGDVILLHGCCHNPTGVEYTNEQWDTLAAAIAAKGIFPIVDTAYQGLGKGLEEDAYGTRKIVDTVPETLVCYSCDKNFGVYRDRVGAFYMVGASSDDLPAITSNANALARANWSMPPDHGGAAIRTILRDPDMTQMWLDELATMRARIGAVRERLAAADNQVPAIDMAQLARQTGLFAMLPISKEQVVKLREDHGVYMAGSGRINIAGLAMESVEQFIAGLKDVTS